MLIFLRKITSEKYHIEVLRHERRTIAAQKIIHVGLGLLFICGLWLTAFVFDFWTSFKIALKLYKQMLSYTAHNIFNAMIKHVLFI